MQALNPERPKHCKLAVDISLWFSSLAVQHERSGTAAVLARAVQACQLVGKLRGIQSS